MPQQSFLSYHNTGVRYDNMDPLKRLAQLEGRKTAINLLRTNFNETEASRGESAYVLEYGDVYFAFVEECLGTKTLVANAMYAITGKTYHENLAQDTVAMMVNDLISVGARPITILAYWAGSEEWFANKKKTEDLVKGWTQACNLAGAVWGGGESPTMKDVVTEGTVDLAGACFGLIEPKERLTLGNKLQAGDAIILLESGGIHANGVSLARKIATQLAKGYKTKISDGRMYGEALLDPTIIYAKLIQELFTAHIDIHYMASITGHGWRKIMRHTKPFTYRVTTIPLVPAVFEFILEKGPVDEKEAYGTFNMGAGFALFVGKKDISAILKIAKKQKIKAYNAGRVEEGKKQVIIEPKNIIFSGESLQVRA